MRIRGYCQPSLFTLILAAGIVILSQSRAVAAGVLDSNWALKHSAAQDHRSWIQTQIDKYTSFPKLDLAMRMMKSGRLNAARLELANLLSRNPGDLRAVSSYLIVLYELRNYQAVISQSTAVLKRNSSFAPALLYRGMAYQALKEQHKALEDFSALQMRTDLEPSDRIFCLESVVDLALAEKDYRRALNASELLEGLKRNAHLFYARALALQGLDRMSEAATALNAALELTVDPVERLTLLRMLGTIARLQGDWRPARDAYHAAVALNCLDPVALRLAAETAYHLGRYSEAIEIMNKLLKASPTADDRRYLGNILLAQRNYRAAETQFRLALRESHDVAQLIGVYRTLIELARLRRDNLEAIRLLRLVISIRPAVRDRRLLASLLEEQKDNSALARELESILGETEESDPRRHDEYMRLGNLYYCEQDFDRAVAAFRKAVTLKETPSGLESLAQALEDSGKTQQAIALRREISKTNSINAANYLKLATLYEKTGAPDEALAALNAALRLEPSSELLLDVYQREGYLYAVQKNHEKARAAFLLAVELSKNRPDLNVALAEICIEIRDYDCALPQLLRANELGTSERALRMLALAYSETNQLVKSAKIYKALSEQAPRPSSDAEELETRLAYVEARLGNFENAAAHFLRAFHDGAEKRLNLLGEAARNYFQVKNFSRAAEAYASFVSAAGAPASADAMAWQNLAICQIELGRYQAAAASIERALSMSGSSVEVHQRLAVTYYERQLWKESLGQFLASLEIKRTLQSLLGVARCYQHLNKPGLAAYYYSFVLEKSDDLLMPERESVLLELGHLYSALAEYSSAVDVWSRCLRLKEDPGARLQLARSQRLSNRFRAAEDTLNAIAPQELFGKLQSEYFDERFALLNRRGDVQAAADALRRANRLEPAAWRDYQLGMFAMSQRNLPEAISFFRTAWTREPYTERYTAALAYAFEKAGDQQNAGRLFNVLAERNPDSSHWRKALAYVDMRLSHNAEAAESLRQALDRTPALDNASATADAKQQNYAMRSDITQLTHSYDLTIYHGHISNSYAGAPAVYWLGPEIFPASTGIEAAYQPPRIGLRNGKMFQLFGRLLWSDDSLPLVGQRYQGGIGARYKPFARPNFWISAERLFHTADWANKGWLLRGLYSWNIGSEPRPAYKAWKYTYSLSDSAYEFGSRHRYFAQYAELRQGVTMKVADNLLFTPHVIGDTRWQSQSGVLGSYLETGGGASLRYLFNQSRYEAPRSSFELLLQFKRGVIFRRAHGVMNNIDYDGCTLVGIFRL